MNPYKQKLKFAALFSVFLGLAPYTPEPHLWGKIKWLMGGGIGMKPMDYFDFLYHLAPFIFLIYFAIKFFTHKEGVDYGALVRDKGTHIIDVREVAEYKGGHFQNAKNYPLSSLQGKVDMIKQLEGPKVVYCRSGQRSSQAIRMLKAAGVEQLYNGGGLSDMNRY